MRPFPAGLNVSKDDSWDISTFVSCPRCKEMIENPSRMRIGLEDEIHCEICQNDFYFEQGFRTLLDLQDPALEIFLFSDSYTHSTYSLQMGHSKFIRNEDLGLDIIDKVQIVNQNADGKIRLVSKDPRGIIVGITQAESDVTKNDQSNYDVRLLIAGKKPNQILPLWSSLLFQSAQRLFERDYSLAIFLSYSSFEVLITALVNAYTQTGRVLNKKTRKDRGDKVVQALTDGKITLDSHRWKLFLANVKRPRNKIAHEAYQASENEAKEALIQTVLFMIKLFQTISPIVQKWMDLPERTATASRILFVRKYYHEILLKNLSSWDPYNADCISHQMYINSPKGKKELINRIKKGLFGFCDTCSKPLLPVGARNKPLNDYLRLYCLSCKQTIKNLVIDGAYFGRWLSDESKAEIVTFSVSPDTRLDDAGRRRKHNPIFQMSHSPTLPPRGILKNVGKQLAERFTLVYFHISLLDSLYGKSIAERLIEGIEDRILEDLPVFSFQETVDPKTKVVFCFPVRDDFDDVGTSTRPLTKLTDNERSNIESVSQAIWRLLRTGVLVSPALDKQKFRTTINDLVESELIRADP